MNICLLLALVAFQKGETQIEERFQVNYVLLDIAAVDKKGKPVTDLKLSDFVIKENKKVVEATFFDILDYSEVFEGGETVLTSTVETETKTTTVPTKPVQQIILALDLESVPVRDVNKVFAQMEQFFDSLDQTRIDYKINLYALERGSLTKGFTQYVDHAKSALAKYRDVFLRGRNRNEAFDSDIPGFGNGNGNGGGINLRGSQGRGGRGNRSMLNNDWADFSDLEDGFAECTQFSNRSGESCQCLSDTLNSYMEQHKYRTERVIGELEILAYKFDEGADLKTMLVVSPGFVLRRLSAATKLYDHFKQIAGCGDGRNSSPFAGRVYVDADFKRVIHACIKNRVIFHTFDIFNGTKADARSMGAEHRGSVSGNVSQAYRDYNNQVIEGLRDLAIESGGTFRQVFRLEGSLTKAIEESRYFYVLGYNSPSGKKGEYRKIKVSVKRRGVKLRYRQGYFGQ